MFGDGWTEILIIIVVAVVVIGPKDLPRVLRMVGRWMGMVRRTANQFQGQFREVLAEAEREAGLVEARKAYEEAMSANPLSNSIADVQSQLAKADEAGEALRRDLAQLSRPVTTVQPDSPEFDPAPAGDVASAPLDLAAAAAGHAASPDEHGASPAGHGTELAGHDAETPAAKPAHDVLDLHTPSAVSTGPDNHTEPNSRSAVL